MTVAVAVLLAAGTAGTQPGRMSYEAAAPVLDALAVVLPPEFRDRPAADVAREWPQWVERRDAEIRARVDRGDEDSVVNFWLYGTSFTALPRAIGRDAAAPREVDELARRRLEDFLDAMTADADGERLRFARRVLGRRGIDPATGAGRARARQYLLDARRRMIDEFAAADRTLASSAARDGGARALATASIFNERGLSSDTSLLADFGVATAIEAMRTQGLLRPGGVRRAAVIGPGLDFTNKADGYDFYPQQTTQPYALIDTLRRLDLAAPDLRVETFDLSARVNTHLAEAAARAAGGEAYVVTLPIDGDEAWTGALLAYWQDAGSRIGREDPAPRPPPSAGNVRVRAVRIDPAVVRSVTPRDLNVVVDRYRPGGDERFDLIVATNVLVYYGVFEQGLAVANIAAMLGPGGVFLTNNAVFPTPPLKPSAQYLKVVYSARQYDELFWYQND